jgi:hypothetical protein
LIQTDKWWITDVIKEKTDNLVSNVNNLIDNTTDEYKDNKNQKANLSAPSPWELKFADAAKLEEDAKSNPFMAPGSSEQLTKDAPSRSMAPESVITGAIPTAEEDKVTGPAPEVIKKSY